MYHDSWMRLLLSYDPPTVVLAHAIRAATLAFYGQTTQDLTLQHEADQWYGLTLHEHRVCVERYLRKNTISSQIPTEAEMSVSMMLMYYELIRPTNPNNWLRHLCGLVQLTQLRGPDNCQSGMSHLLFRAIRSLMVFTSRICLHFLGSIFDFVNLNTKQVYLSIQTRQLSPFIVPEWCSIPFFKSGKTSLDYLVDALLLVPTLLAALNEPVYWSKNQLVEVTELENKLLSNQHRYTEEMSSAPQQHHSELPQLHFPVPTGEAMCDMASGGDFCSVIPIMMYHASWLIIRGIRHTQAAPFTLDAPPCNDDNQEQFSTSDSLFRFLDTFTRDTAATLNHGFCMQIIFTLNAIQEFSTSVAHRTSAQEYMSRMGWS